MNSQQQLSPLALAMIDRCSAIVSAHLAFDEVSLASLEKFAGRYREKLTAGHTVLIRRRAVTGKVIWPFEADYGCAALEIGVLAPCPNLPWEDQP